MKYLLAFINGVGYLYVGICGVVILSYYFALDAKFESLCHHADSIQAASFWTFFAWLLLKPLHTIADGMGRYLDELNESEAAGTSVPSQWTFIFRYIWSQHLLWRIPLVLLFMLVLFNCCDTILANY